MSTGAKDGAKSGAKDAEPRVIDLGGPAGPDGEREVSAFELERYHAEELPLARRQEIEARLASDAALAAELDALRVRDAAFRAAMPFERFRADHETRLLGTSGGARVRAWWSSRRWTLGAGVVVAAAAALLLVVLAPGGDPLAPSLDDVRQTRLKGGGARIGFFVKADGGARWGEDGEELRAGDRIQLAVRDPAGARSMVIVGVDGRGEVSTYVVRRLPTGTPKGEPEAAPRLLEQSLVLDDALGAERFFVLYRTGAAGADVDGLERAAMDAARAIASGVTSGAFDLRYSERLPLALDDVEQGSVHIVKVPNKVPE